MSDLVELATRFVSLSAELDTIRAGMKRLLLNGGGGVEPPGPERPTLARRLGRDKKAATRAAQGGQPPNVLAEAAKAEAQILDLLRAETNGLKTIDVARNRHAAYIDAEPLGETAALEPSSAAQTKDGAERRRELS